MRWAALALLLLVGCREREPEIPWPFEVVGMCYDCDTIVTNAWSPRQIQRAVDALPQDGIICFRPGKYRSRQFPWLRSYMSIVGIIDADDNRPWFLGRRANPTCPADSFNKREPVRYVLIAQLGFRGPGQWRL